MSLPTLPYRCHLASGSGDISSLYTEVSGYYNSGSISMILGNKLVSELCKRKRVTFHNYTCGLGYFSGITSGSPPPSNEWLWESGISLLWESGISMLTE